MTSSVSISVVPYIYDKPHPCKDPKCREILTRDKPFEGVIKRVSNIKNDVRYIIGSHDCKSLNKSEKKYSVSWMYLKDIKEIHKNGFLLYQEMSFVLNDNLYKKIEQKVIRKISNAINLPWGILQIILEYRYPWRKRRDVLIYFLNESDNKEDVEAIHLRELIDQSETGWNGRVTPCLNCNSKTTISS